MEIKKILIVALILCCFWSIFFGGLRVATDHPLWSQPILEELADLPFIWREILTDGIGKYVLTTLWLWPVTFLFGLLGKFGLDFSLITSLTNIFPVIIVCLVGTSRLLNYFSIRGIINIIGSVFYLLNSYLLLLVDGGQMHLGLAYALFPLLFLSYRYAIEKLSYSNAAKFSLIIVLMSIFDIRGLYIFGFLAMVDILFELFYSKHKKKLLVNVITLTLASMIFFIGINAYWILPGFLLKSPNLSATYLRVDQVNALSFSQLGHSLLFLQPHWPKNIFGLTTPILPEFFVIPILAFLPGILKIKDRWVGYWLIVAVISIFLTKGSNDPFPGIYSWLFTNLPGFSLFRDPSKFFFLTSLSYTILISIALFQISSVKLNNIYLSKLLKIVPAIFVIYIIYLIRPLYLDQMTGMFTKPFLEASYRKLSINLQNDPEFSRVLWIPNFSPLGFSSSVHPFLESSEIANKRPFLVNRVGSYEVSNYIRESNYMNQLFDVFGIGYIIYPPLDPKRIDKRDQYSPDLEGYYSAFLDQLTNLSWVKRADIDESKVPVLKTSSHQDRFFAVSNIWWIIGSDSIYENSTMSGTLNLSDNALVFSEEYPGLGDRLKDIPNIKIILNNKTLVDLASSFIDRSLMLFPAEKLKLDPGENGWWKRDSSDFIKWREFLQSKYSLDYQEFDFGGGLAISEGSNQLKLSDNRFESGKLLLARLMESSRSGQVSFHQGLKKIGSAITLNNYPGLSHIKLSGYKDIPSQEFTYSKSNLLWKEIGILNSNQPIIINTQGDLNVINAVAIIEPTLWEKYKLSSNDLSNNFVSSYTPDNIKEVSDKPLLSYTRVNSTKYVVKLLNQSKNGLVVFSQGHDPLWKIGSQSAIPVYSSLNLFEIGGDGKYIVEFEPQKYVYYGLVISSITLLIFISVFLFRNRQ